VVNGDVPLVVCVSADIGVRERMVRRLEDCGAVLMCDDLDQLRAMLFPGPEAAPPGVTPAGIAPSGVTTSGVTPSGVTPSGVAPPAADVLRHGELVVDPAGHVVLWRGRPLPLTRLERELLGRLASPPVGVWTYQRLFDAVWGQDFLGDPSILHSAVKRLRGKLRVVDGEFAVETVRGVGYRLASPPGAGEPAPRRLD